MNYHKPGTIAASSKATANSMSNSSCRRSCLQRKDGKDGNYGKDGVDEAKSDKGKTGLNGDKGDRAENGKSVA